MQETLDALLRTYKADFSQEERDLAETFCNATTRFGGGAIKRMPRPLTEDMRGRAVLHGIDIERLTRAIALYEHIEQCAEATHRRNRRN